MKTTELFKFNRSAKRMNESLEKTFGTKINLESFDLPKLQDARNKLRTQISQVRGESGFNETTENDAFAKAQFMLDAINAEIAERSEFIVGEPVAEGHNDLEAIIHANHKAVQAFIDGGFTDMDHNLEMDLHGYYYDKLSGSAQRDADDEGEIAQLFSDDLYDMGYVDSNDEGGETDDAYALASAGFGSDEDYGSYDEAYDMDQVRRDAEAGVKASIDKQSDDRIAKLKQGGEKDEPFMAQVGRKIIGGVKGAAKGFMGKESIEQTGDDMRNLREGEIQQASAIVTAKTMVDRVGRWIEELSGMENDTLLQLGDSIRDEMGQEQAKQFISACAPAIQAALQNLKDTREALSSSVRGLTGEEQSANMLGTEPGMDAEPDALNAAPADAGEGEDDIAFGPPEDDFAAAEPAAGGMEAAGREKRESIERGNNLLRVLAG